MDHSHAMPKIINQPIRTWGNGDLVQGFALLTKREVRQDRNGKSYMDLELADASGSIVAKVWSDSPARRRSYIQPRRDRSDTWSDPESAHP